MVVVWLHWTVESFFFNTNDGLDCVVNVYFPEPTESSFLVVIIGVGATKHNNIIQKLTDNKINTIVKYASTK